MNPARSFGPAVVLKTFNGYRGSCSQILDIWLSSRLDLLGWTYPRRYHRCWLLQVACELIPFKGRYRLTIQKWLQYETVLGPETDDDHPAPRVTGPDQSHDVEKNAGSGGESNSGGNFVVAGPGLSDLLTEGPQGAVFELERQPGPLEARLERIEAILMSMAENGQGAQRVSTSTFVEDLPERHGKGISPATSATTATHDDTQGGDEVFQGNRLAAPTGQNPHVHGHQPFQHEVAGAGDRPHVDAKRI